MLERRIERVVLYQSNFRDFSGLFITSNQFRVGFVPDLVFGPFTIQKLGIFLNGVLGF